MTISRCSFALSWGLVHSRRRTFGLSFQAVAGANFRYVDFRSKWPVGRIAKCSPQHCVVLVCKARRPADFMHSGDFHALGMKYLPWCVRSRSLLQCRSSIWVCRSAASRGCLECSTSRKVRAESGSSNSAVSCVSGRGVHHGHRHRRARLPAERAGKLLWRSLRGAVQGCACVKCCHTLLSRDEMYMFVWRCFSCSSKVARVEIATLSGLSADLHCSGCEKRSQLCRCSLLIRTVRVVCPRVEIATLLVLSPDLRSSGCLSACRDRNSVGALC